MKAVVVFSADELRLYAREQLLYLELELDPETDREECCGRGQKAFDASVEKL